MGISFRFGQPKNRLGMIVENWIRTPETHHYSRALPADTDWEVTKLYGIFVCNCFIGIQRFSHRTDREKQGFQFGPAPNVLHVIRDAE